jgi:hypothetical protein
MTSGGRCPKRHGRALSLATITDRSVSSIAWSIEVTSAMRRDHSRTLPCNMKRSRSRAMSTRLTTWANSKATMEVAISRPKSDCGHRERRIFNAVAGGDQCV